MIPELEETAETSNFKHVDGVDKELQRLMEAPDYAKGIDELNTRHEVPAYVEEDAVTKVVPEGSSPAVINENIEALADADIAFPSGVIWEESVDGEIYDVVQHRKAYGSQDLGFWNEFNNYINDFRSMGEDAAEQGVYLDFKPQNFGIMNGELVYIDTADTASVKNDLDPEFARNRMARQLHDGMVEASYQVDKNAFREIAEVFDPNLQNIYSKR